MKVLIVHAHPEPQSFTTSMLHRAVSTLEAQGHTVTVSDLYAMQWNPVASAADFGVRKNPDYLVYALEQRENVAAHAIARLLHKYRWIGFVGLAIVLYVALHMMWQGHQDVVQDLGYAPAYNAVVPDFMDISPEKAPAH